MNSHHRSPAKKRCSGGIASRIKALQASGCGLEGGTTIGVASLSKPPTRRQQRHSFPNNIKRSNETSILSPEVETSARRMLRTSIQLPITPCLEDLPDEDKYKDKLEDSKHSSSVSFADMTDVCFIPNLDDDEIDCDALYYKEEEVANMKHEAFLEKIGLSHMI